MIDYQVVNPATGEQSPLYPLIGDGALDAVTGAADRAYRTWGRTSSIQERSHLLASIAGLHRSRREELANIIVTEIGKPLSQALGEVDFAADIFDYYAANAQEFLRDEPIKLLTGEGSALLRKGPVGVLLGIMPWNYPYYQVARFAAPNLLLGNTIILKHAPQCPESSAAVQDLVASAGAPAGVYTNVYASNEQIADLIADPRVQGVSLTGSERAGAAVAETAGRHLKKVVLELGGSDPFILLSTDDLDGVVEAAVQGRLENNGQACNAAKRFLIIDELFEAFTERFTRAMNLIRPADPTLARTFLGPLSSTAAAERLESQLDVAVAHGASVVAGGKRDGSFFPATVLTGLDAGNPAYQEEFFGPVASIRKVASEEEAIALANDSVFGLGSYVFSTDPEQALRVADGLEAGMVFINGVGAESPELPFGGVKKSGYGRELGRRGLNEFVNQKLIRIIK
jgi:succinate-semialdehyde dehydrogenase/glutarate-semialdehyde dehydrogenase